MKKNKKQEIRKKNEKKIHAGFLGLFLIIAVSFLTLMLDNPNDRVTGSLVYVNYYDNSNPPLKLDSICPALNTYCPKGAQTLITLHKNDLEELLTDKTAQEVTNKIISASNLEKNLLKIYQESLKAEETIPLPTSGLEIVTPSSELIISELKTRTGCLNQIANHLTTPQTNEKNPYQFVILNYISFKECTSYPNWLVASLNQDYYSIEGEFICSSGSDKLFSVEKKTGRLSKGLGSC